jgi:hypothetical protein
MVSMATITQRQILMPEAGKADIWRLAVVLRYGGIYVDSDVKALHPFRDYLWPNASVVSGMGVLKDFHQWWAPINAVEAAAKLLRVTPINRVAALHVQLTTDQTTDMGHPYLQNLVLDSYACSLCLYV